MEKKVDALIDLAKKIMDIIQTDCIDEFFNRIRENEELYNKISADKNIKALFSEYL